MAATRTPPILTPQVVGDDAAVAARIDDLLRPDPRYGGHVQAILRAQGALRRVLADREWEVFLDLEAVSNARLTYAMCALVRWAFNEGRVHRVCRSR